MPIKDRILSDFGALAVRVICAIQGKRQVLAQRADGSLMVIDETMRAGVLRARVLSLIERWKIAGDIGTKEVNAAKNFHSDYLVYHRQPRYSSSKLIYVDGGNAVDMASLGHLKERARKRLNTAYRAIGTIATPVVIDVLGEDKPLYQCSVPKDRAKRIILKALPKIAEAYGYGK